MPNTDPGNGDIVAKRTDKNLSLWSSHSNGRGQDINQKNVICQGVVKGVDKQGNKTESDGRMCAILFKALLIR